MMSHLFINCNKRQHCPSQLTILVDHTDLFIHTCVDLVVTFCSSRKSMYSETVP
jgi:hypothetical protein